MLGEMIANFTLNFILGYLIGINGVIIATIATVTFFSIIASGKTTINICFEKRSTEYFKEMCLHLVTTLIAASATYFVCNCITAENLFLKLILRFGVCCLLPNILFLSLSMMKKRYRVYLSQFKELLFNRK